MQVRYLTAQSKTKLGATLPPSLRRACPNLFPRNVCAPRARRVAGTGRFRGWSRRKEGSGPTARGLKGLRPWGWKCRLKKGQDPGEPPTRTFGNHTSSDRRLGYQARRDRRTGGEGTSLSLGREPEESLSSPLITPADGLPARRAGLQVKAFPYLPRYEVHGRRGFWRCDSVSVGVAFRFLFLLAGEGGVGPSRGGIRGPLAFAVGLGSCTNM
ncbi:hypothetical protein DFJ73DRAFT_179674 [Zopfochytrium polystomum]|nr:hypothetical protein DFJ73DRAFT_179674 [Zopfochytrium polystomum]